MKTIKLNEELLELYYSKSFNKLRTGLDKITPTKFQSIRQNEYKIIINKIENFKYKFTRLKKVSLPSNRDVFIPTIRDRLVLNYLKDVLNIKFRIKYPNRDDIIESLIKKFDIQDQFFIIRIDIKSFFDTIPINKLLHKIKKTCLLSNAEYSLVKNILKINSLGIPQGLPISNPLSEIFLEEFDFKMRRIDQSLNYYCRYVDDILLVFNGEFNNTEKNEITLKINKILNSFGLTQNQQKYQEVLIKNKKNTNFDYLGYDFQFEKGILNLKIKKTKINNQKDKINNCFDEYIKEKKINNVENINLLIERINFLTKNHLLIKKVNNIDFKKNESFYKINFITSGFLYSYRFAKNDYLENLTKELDQLLLTRIQSIQHLISSRNAKRILYSISTNRNYVNNKILPIARFTTQEYRKRIKFIEPAINLTFLNNMTFNQLERYYFNKIDLNNN